MAILQTVLDALNAVDADAVQLATDQAAKTSTAAAASAAAAADAAAAEAQLTADRDALIAIINNTYTPSAVLAAAVKAERAKHSPAHQPHAQASS